MKMRPAHALRRTIASVLTGAALAGCASPPTPLVTDPVGPLGSASVRFWNQPVGMLVVHTDKETVDDGGILYSSNTSYRITTPDGRKVRSVGNRAGRSDGTPATVMLPEGQYRVHALAEGKGWVTVPVLIRPNRLTVVNLEIQGLPEAAALPESERVRLPDGRVIGRRAPAMPAQSTGSNPAR
ncbi:MAG: hypothetical protein JXQ71_01530 [Verrucomicrobia bacterium]|nr:hypothetical protein [Verrucomicrobiota bacterium]